MWRYYLLVFVATLEVSLLAMSAATGDVLAGFVLGIIFVLAIQNLGFFSPQNPVWDFYKVRGGPDPEGQTVHSLPGSDERKDNGR